MELTLTLISPLLGKTAFTSLANIRRIGRHFPPAPVPFLSRLRGSLPHTLGSRFANRGLTSTATERPAMALDDVDDSVQPNGNSPPTLVDVDCNLLHHDLASAMDSMSLWNISDSIPTPLRILHHPSTTKSNIAAMISPSSTIDESEKSVRLLSLSDERSTNGVAVKTTVGVHPYHALEEGDPDTAIASIRALLHDGNAERVISCIGETGLDYSKGFPDREHQIPWFEVQLDLAYEYGLPVFLHERMAFEDTLRYIDEAAERHAGVDAPGMIVHCFTGSRLECAEYMRRGYHTSISGYICKAGEGGDEVRSCLREGIIPLDRLMIETDAPYMAFQGNKDSFFDAEGDAFISLPSKKRKRLKSMYPNVPSSLPLVLDVVCNEINRGRAERGEPAISRKYIAQMTTNNAIRFFRIDTQLKQIGISKVAAPVRK